MFELIHITAAYSNAVLVAILPHVSDFAKGLDLPGAQPVTASQVAWFKPLPFKGQIDGALVLTNNYWFHFSWHGYVCNFRSPNDWFFEQNPATQAAHYVGKVNMTTNEAVQMARRTLSRLGYQPELMHADGPPKQIEGPFQIDKGAIPFCRITWEGPQEKTEAEERHRDSVRIAIDMARKAVVELAIEGTNCWRTPPTVGVEPELEADYLKRMKIQVGKMFVRTNAPTRIVRPILSPPKKGQGVPETAN
jgi:hypothetical protein